MIEKDKKILRKSYLSYENNILYLLKTGNL